jgi:hypothetical protein
MEKICALKVKIIAFFWRLFHLKLWRSPRKERVIPKNSPFCFKVTERGIYACPYLISTSEGDCCMYKAERLKRRAEKICDHK